MRSVTCDSADNSVNGSNEVEVWLRLSASIGMFRTAI
jgi:pyrroloquinoline quinone (PQQ) biosynthesis protein C